MRNIEHVQKIKVQEKRDAMKKKMASFKSSSDIASRLAIVHVNQGGKRKMTKNEAAMIIGRFIRRTLKKIRAEKERKK